MYYIKQFMEYAVMMWILIFQVKFMVICKC